jgi:hypothetical protein
MYRRTLAIVAFALGLCIVANTACTKKDNAAEPAYECTSCKKTPDALPANDASVKGIYKGIFIGSSGTVVFDVQNGSNAITARLVIDGVTINLSSTVTVTNGQPYVAPFTGTYNGQPVTVVFSVGVGGTSPTVTTASIPGHPNAVFTIVKETSTSLIECFEGTYNSSRPETGVFNIVLSRAQNAWGGTARAVTGSTSTSSINGTINSSGTLFQSNNGSQQQIGTLTGDVISGSFVDSNGRNISISGRRTL